MTDFPIIEDPHDMEACVSVPLLLRLLPLQNLEYFAELAKPWFRYLCTHKDEARRRLT